MQEEKDFLSAKPSFYTWWFIDSPPVAIPYKDESWGCVYEFDDDIEYFLGNVNLVTHLMCIQ